MVQSKWSWQQQLLVSLSLLPLSSVLTIVLASFAGLAQITPDTTLGAEQSLLQGAVIRGGAQRGANLFHSFLQFNVGNGQRVDFANPTGVDRILARVTGSSRSAILGTLGVLGNADLFLINPNGILFGRNARLDVRGSFLATTASAVQFGDQGVFSADAPATPPLLTVNPSALWFNRLPVAPIVNQSIATAGLRVVGLRVPDGRNLLLVGGNVQFERGTVSAFGGRVEVGGLAAPGVVELTPAYQLRFPAGVERADVSFTNRSVVSVVGGGGGDVVVTARNIEIAQQSAIQAGISFPGVVARQAGAIALDATGAINVSGQGSLIENAVYANAVGNTGGIQVRARNFSVTDGATVVTYISGQGHAGNIDIAATEAISLSGTGSQFPSTIASQVAPNQPGTGGSVRLRTANLAITNGAQIANATFGQGNAGDVTLIADTIAIDGTARSGASAITSSVAPRAVGNGGVIDIQTGTLTLTNGGRVFASTFGQGNAGGIRINARDRILLDGASTTRFPSAVVSQVAAPAVGNGGSIQVTGAAVTVLNGAQIVANTFGRGDAGDITIRAQNAVVFDGVNSNNIPSGVFSNVENRATGSGGDIFITGDSLRLTNAAGLFASTSGQGDAGKIQVQTATNVQLATEGRILSTVESTGIGNGQEIDIRTRSLSLTTNAQINAGTNGEGVAGRIQIAAQSLDVTTGGQLRTATTARGRAGDMLVNVGDRVTLTGNESGLFANTAPDSDGNGGSIFLSANRLNISNMARIAVDSQGRGQGGDIVIRANQILLDNQAVLSAETASTQGGNITIQNSGLLLLRNHSLISTSAGTAQAGGNGGNMTINSRFIVSVLKENNDIRANAFTGNGGNIRITAQGIFGIQYQPFDTPNSDITASSQFGLNGIVNLNTPDLDPTRGTVDLPATFNTPSLAIGCNAQASQSSSFVNTGRGGIPTSPIAPLTADAIWQSLDPLPDQEDNTTPTESRQVQETHFNGQSPAASPDIVEAQSLNVLPDGTIFLTVQVPWQLRETCN